MSKVQERLRERRTARKLSLRRLGALANLSHTYIADIEKGRADGSLDALSKLAVALATSVGYLLGETDNPDAQLITSAKVISSPAPPARETAYQALQAAEGLSDSEMGELRAYIEIGLKWMRRRK